MAGKTFVDVPPGHVATVVTFLEMLQPPPAFGDQDRGRALRPLRGGDVDLYLTAFRRLGERWLWFSRLMISRDDVAAILDDPGVVAFEVVRGCEPIGLLELDFRRAGEAELAFFGFFENHVGQGHGRWLMDRAVAMAFSRKISRLFVHSCTADHPSALAFYRRCGFKPYRVVVEIDPDPRMRGVLSRSAAAHVPIIES